MANEKTKVSEKPSAYSPDYLDVLSKCEKVAKVQSLTLSTEDRLSTGLLGLDGILGGGITAGMYTFFGPEQSAKTTAAITIAGASIHQDVGLRILWDAENSSGSSTDYISNIFNTLKVKTDVESVFGVKKDGKYFVKPQIYYRDEGEAEKYFDYLAALLRRLPNKRYEDKRWWFVYPRDKEHLAQFGSVMDKKMSSMNDAIYIPAKNGALQGLIVVDSYPSLVPSEADEDDASGALALQARTFSQGLQRIKGKLRAKRFAIVGINQLRTAPMVRFGSPEYEPCGMSLKFYSDVRLRMYPHALSAAPFNPKEGEDKGFESEESIFGGKDKYRYIKATAHKNKLSVPGRFTWLRLWVEDHEGQGRGYDPVFDTLWALHVTKQVEPMSSKKNIRLHPHGRDAMKKTISMTQFKQLIIGTNEMKAEVWSYLGINKVIDLRAYLRKQMLTGQYEDLYIAARNSKPVKEEESE